MFMTLKSELYILFFHYAMFCDIEYRQGENLSLNPKIHIYLMSYLAQTHYRQ